MLVFRMVTHRLMSDLLHLTLGGRMLSFKNMFIPINRQIYTTPNFRYSIRDNHKQGTGVPGIQQEVIEGTLGADKRNAVNTKEAYSRFPTPQTLKELFGGIPYNELPIVYVKATKNNTLVTVTDHKNNVITYTSCRLEGFVNARKKTTIAGQTTGVAAGQRLMRRGIGTVRVQVKGLGPGRITCIKGLTVAGVNVVSITDHTPVPELGPRPRKIRRV